MEFFAVQYMNEAEEWVTVKEVKDNIRKVYRFTLKDPIVTTKFRLKVPRALGFTSHNRGKTFNTGRNWSTECTRVQEDSRD